MRPLAIGGDDTAENGPSTGRQVANRICHNIGGATPRERKDREAERALGKPYPLFMFRRINIALHLQLLRIHVLS